MKVKTWLTDNAHLYGHTADEIEESYDSYCMQAEDSVFNKRGYAWGFVKGKEGQQHKETRRFWQVVDAEDVPPPVAKPARRLMRYGAHGGNLEGNHRVGKSQLF